MALTNNPAKVRKTRKPSEFEAVTRCTIMVHHDADGGQPEQIAAALRDWYDGLYEDDVENAPALRFVQRTRHTAKGTGTGPKSLTLYIAPPGFTFPKAGGPRGMRLPADVAAALRAKAAEIGLDANDPNVATEVLRALLTKAAK